MGKTEHAVISARLLLGELEAEDTGEHAPLLGDLRALLDGLALDLRERSRHRATVLKLAREARMELERLAELVRLQ